MKNLRAVAVSVVVTCMCVGGGLGQISVPKTAVAVVPWAPVSLFGFPDGAFPKATGTKVMMVSLSVEGMPIILEETMIVDVQKRFGAEFGHSGDAGDSLGWFCLEGNDPGGNWVFWLISGEIDGPTIGSFQWKRISADAVVDPRCHQVGDVGVAIRPPWQLQLGDSEIQVGKILGKPALVQGGTRFFVHDHKEMIRNEEIDVSSSVAVRIGKGQVEEIEVIKTSTN